MGESFDYTEVALRVEARLNGSPLLTDAMEIRPEKRSPESLGLFEPYPYLGSFYVLGGKESVLDDLTGELEDILSGAEGVSGGACRLEGPGVMVRWLAESPVRLRWAFNEIWNIARLSVLDRKAVRLRKF
jgi:urease accessory protein UreH